MKTPVKLAAFAAGLGAVFAAATGVGMLVGPVSARAPEQGGATMTRSHDNRHQAGTSALKGLQVSQDGYTLAPSTRTLPVGGGTYSFRVLGPDGEPVTRYARSHDKNLHLIVVRRDLAGFAHVHPTMRPDGTWSVPLRPAAGAGSYRVFADFTPAGHDGLTLGADLEVAGDFQPVDLPAPSRTAIVDGYTVLLDGDLRSGTSSKLILTVAKDGQPVTDLEPYLGAYGHLVALRTGDLAYLHVHPDGTPGDGSTKPGPSVTFYAEVPTPGAYRLYLDFQHGGTVRTAEFTAVAAGTAPRESTGEQHGHGHD